MRPGQWEQVSPHTLTPPTTPTDNRNLSNQFAYAMKLFQVSIFVRLSGILVATDHVEMRKSSKNDTETLELSIEF